MQRSGTQPRSGRRTFLKTTAGVAGLAALAGCTGGSDGGDGGGDGGSDGGSDGQSGDGSADGGSGPTDMVMTTATETTAAYAMSQGIAAVVNENAEKVRVDARPSEGTNANIGRLDRGEVQIAYIQNWTAAKINAGKKPFDSLSFSPNQVFHLYDLGWFLATANGDWKTTADITDGARVSPTPRGSGTAEMLEKALGYAGAGDYKRVSIDYGGQGSAMSEGRLDVGASTLVNFSIEPGWLQEMKGTVDLRMLGWSDDAISKMQEDPGILLTEVDTSGLENYAYTPQPTMMPSLAYNFVVRNDFSYDAVYALLTTLYENREGLGEYHGLLNELKEGEFWVKNAYDGIPFHPAAADFYEEQGLWSDEFTRGEE